MDIADRMACADVIQAWGFARDQGQWEDLLETFHPRRADPRLLVSGRIPGLRRALPAELRQGLDGEASALAGARDGERRRAISEINVAIMVRQVIEGVETDLTSNSRFLDRLEKRDGQWRMVERACVYEQDRLAPVEPSPKFDAMMQSADTAKYPALIATWVIAWRPRDGRSPSRCTTTAAQKPKRSRSATRIGSPENDADARYRASAFKWCRASALLEQILHLVEAGLDAGLVLLAAGCARCAR